MPFQFQSWIAPQVNLCKIQTQDSPVHTLATLVYQPSEWFSPPDIASNGRPLTSQQSPLTRNDPSSCSSMGMAAESAALQGIQGHGCKLCVLLQAAANSRRSISAALASSPRSLRANGQDLSSLTVNWEKAFLAGGGIFDQCSNSWSIFRAEAPTPGSRESGSQSCMQRAGQGSLPQNVLC